MTYAIKVSKRDLSMYAEECVWKDEEGHNADGIGPACDAHCKSLDGDTRLIRDYGTSTYEYDDGDAEEYGSPVEWAATWLEGKDFPSLYKNGTGPARDHDWLSGSEDDPYKDEFTEYSIYLTGDWTDIERGVVFDRVSV